MNKLNKITGWTLGIIGIVLAIWGFISGFSEGYVNVVLRYTYILLTAAVVIWLLLALVITGTNNPKGLVKAGIFVLAAAAVVFVAYMFASGAPAFNVKMQPSVFWLKLTDTMLLLTYILGVAAFCAIIYGVIRSSITNK